MAGDIDADLVQHRNGEQIQFPGPQSHGVDKDLLAVKHFQNALSHRRPQGILGTTEENAAREVSHAAAQPRICRTQIKVKSRRAVLSSKSILPASRSFSSSAPSLWSPRLPISMASIWDGDAVLIAA